MQYEYRTFSECGPRWKNEDTLEMVEMPEQGRTLFILYNGMGGHRMRYLVSLTVAYQKVCKYITPEMEDKTDALLNKWFPEYTKYEVIE